MASVGETTRLISSEKVEGTSVVDTKGNDLGHISEIMIDKVSGKVGYAVLKSGSFLGMGGKLFAVPWDILKYDTREDAYVIGIPSERLKAAPSYDPSNPPNFEDRDWSRKVHDYYGSRADWYMGV
jgi:sporulation protein YlmC with PRC-barrel domain